MVGPGEQSDGVVGLEAWRAFRANSPQLRIVKQTSGIFFMQGRPEKKLAGHRQLTWAFGGSPAP